jgi:hypothetical protein
MPPLNATGAEDLPPAARETTLDSSQGSTSPSVAAASPLLVHDGCGAAQTLTPAAPCFQFSPDDAGSQARAPVLAESGVVPGEPPEDAHIEPAASACGGLASCARSSASCLEPEFGGEQSMLTSDPMEATLEQSVLVGAAPMALLGHLIDLHLPAGSEGESTCSTTNY